MDTALVPPGINPTVMCCICGRSRDVCLAPGSYNCQAMVAAVELPSDTIRRLAKEVDEWAELATIAVESLSKEPKLRNLCAWCRQEFDGPDGNDRVRDHVLVCETNPVVQRLARARQTLLLVGGFIDPQGKLGGEIADVLALLASPIR